MKHLAPFLLPAGLFLVICFLFPLLLGIGVSFFSLDKSTLEFSFGAPFCGLSNYQAIFSAGSSYMDGLLDALENTVMYTICVSVGSIGLGLGGALLVMKNFRGARIVRPLLLLSWVVPSYVVGILWGFMWQQDDGIINTVLFDFLHWDVISKQFGVVWSYSATGELVKPLWLTGQNTIWAIIIPTIWRNWPFCMMMFLAGLTSIPGEIYEASAMDGASPRDQFFRITLPLLKPVFALIVLQNIILNVFSFNIVAMMFGNGSGFPGKYGDLLMTFLYRTTFQTWNLGIGAALSTVFMGMMLAVVFLWYGSFWKEYNDG
ncbi:MAG: sugar ABC transporter permease [Fibrobacteraceae bacterium]|jgi:multiple sugar transport system permease protein